jgi:hypothetical protein
LTFTADSSHFGRFINRATGDTLSTLTDVEYQHARSDTMIRYLADGANPAQPRQFSITVTRVDDTLKAGRGLLTVKPALTILLGETKYFRARNHPTQADRLIIEETAEPELDGAIAEDVWVSDPVAVVSGDGHGRKMGVYWEKEKPILGDTTNLLPRGLIRVVGRYWHPDSVYKVKLSANYQGRQGRVTLEVLQPSRLGDGQLAERFRTGITVNSVRYNIDSVCIHWGGLHGFPPQHIKGQYSSESVYDDALQAVAPAYRYEPWTAEFSDAVRNERLGHFWVDTDMGTGDPVPNHANTRYMSYVNTPHSVWYFIEQYSTVVFNQSPAGYVLFGRFQQATGRLTFPNYRRPTREYSRIRRGIYRNLNLDPSVENQQANLLARQTFIQYMSAEYLGGLTNRPAQSRIASSYGPLQIMYTTALERDYGRGAQAPPEYLNVLDTFFPFAMDHMLSLLRRQTQADHNWNRGWESTIRSVYGGWNTRAAYPGEVMTAAQSFPPIR